MEITIATSLGLGNSGTNCREPPPLNCAQSCNRYWGVLTSSASFSSVSSLFSCWSFALFLKASFSGLLIDREARLGD